MEISFKEFKKKFSRITVLGFWCFKNLDFMDFGLCKFFFLELSTFMIMMFGIVSFGDMDQIQ
jgi:hypothetical protein